MPKKLYLSDTDFILFSYKKLPPAFQTYHIGIQPFFMLHASSDEKTNEVIHATTAHFQEYLSRHNLEEQFANAITVIDRGGCTDIKVTGREQTVTFIKFLLSESLFATGNHYDSEDSRAAIAAVSAYLEFEKNDSVQENELEIQLSSLHLAVFDDDIQAASAILTEISDPALNDFYGNNALDIAIIKGSDELIDLLLDAGVSPSTLNPGYSAIYYSDVNTTSIEYAVQHRPAVAEKLIRAGADLTPTNSNGRALLSTAIASGHKGLVYLILEMVPQLATNTDVFGLNVINILIDRKRMSAYTNEELFELMSKLYQAGARMDGECIFTGTTPLIQAAYAGRADICTQLITNYHVDVNFVNSKDGTALINAILSQNHETVNCLIELGANVNLRNGAELVTACIKATSSGNPEGIDIIVSLLRAQCTFTPDILHEEKTVLGFVKALIQIDNIELISEQLDKQQYLRWLLKLSCKADEYEIVNFFQQRGFRIFGEHTEAHESVFNQFIDGALEEIAELYKTKVALDVFKAIIKIDEADGEIDVLFKRYTNQFFLPRNTQAANQQRRLLRGVLSETFEALARCERGIEYSATTRLASLFGHRVLLLKALMTEDTRTFWRLPENELQYDNEHRPDPEKSVDYFTKTYEAMKQLYPELEPGDIVIATYVRIKHKMFDLEKELKWEEQCNYQKGMLEQIKMQRMAEEANISSGDAVNRTGLNQQNVAIQSRFFNLPQTRDAAPSESEGVAEPVVAVTSYGTRHESGNEG